MKNYELLLVDNYFVYKKFCKESAISNECEGHRHHIIPRFLGGTDDEENIVKLTHDNHIKAHILLSECFEESTDAKIGNLRSARFLGAMVKCDMSGKNNPFFGKTHTKESMQKAYDTKVKNGTLNDKPYDEWYGDKAENEKLKRSIGVKNSWNSYTSEEKEKRLKNVANAIAKIDPEIKSQRARHAAIAGLKHYYFVDGIKFETLSDACKHFGVTGYFLNKKHKFERFEK